MKLADFRRLALSGHERLGLLLRKLPLNPISPAANPCSNPGLKISVVLSL
jgi:hypothetical protein